MVTGVPPAIANVGTGSEQVRIGATMEHLINQYWVGTVQPLMNRIAEQLTAQLLPYYVGDLRRFRMAPDFEHSPVLAKLRAEAHKRQMEAAIAGYHSGLLGYAEAREIGGFSSDIPPDRLEMPFGPSIVVAQGGAAKQGDLPALQKVATIGGGERDG